MTTGRSFHGQLAGRSGRVASVANAVTLVLGSGAARRTLVITTPLCRRRPRCLALSARVTVTLTARHSLPDIGRSYTVSGAANVAPLGRVVVSGVAAGTGNIRTGRDRLDLRLTGRQGVVELSASSGPVGPFSMP